jgi:FHA domain-containing protein
MPQVTLDLVSLDNNPVAGVSRVFEGSGGTIGRDEGNTLALPDSHRRVSRLHATISFPGGVPTITNSSTVLTIGVGGMQLESGRSMSLLPGMSLAIGPYVLVVRAPELAARATPVAADATVSLPLRQPPGEVVAQSVAASPSADPAPPHPYAMGAGSEPGRAMHPAAAAPAAAGADPFAELLSGLAPAPAGTGGSPGAPLNPVDDPLAALLGSSASPVPQPPGGSPVAGLDPFAALGAGARPPFVAGGQSPVRPLPFAASPPAADVIPEDFNPFDLPSAAARNTADPLAPLAAASAASAPHALTQGEESIDALFAPSGAGIGEDLLNGGSARDGLFGGVAAQGAALLAQPDLSDPLALFGGAPRENEGLLQPMRDDLAEVGGAYQPPRAFAPVLPRAPAAPAPPVAQAEPLAAPALPSHPADALTRAFLAGANLPPGALPGGLTPEIMAMVGSLLRSATAGAIDMLAIRANIKREVQASVTIISSDDNNPLKFLLDADSVLLQLLGRRAPGFMPPDEAMKDAFNDLRAHELGVIAGTRAALGEVLTKFDPAILGERLIRGSLLEMALPAMRKTKLWDLYLERYAQMRREVEDDFQSIFGKAFVAAYEEESARMKAASHARKS